jgi:hypothetical protein
MFTVFCDETGNSGSRYFSPEQPVFAEGGWFVRNDHRVKLETTILELETQFGFTPQTKGTRLKDSRKGQEYIAAVLDYLGRLAVPFFYLVEKKYFIRAKAVETYFDPDYNPAVDPEELSDPDARKFRADVLYAVPDEILQLFAEAFRDQDPYRLVLIGSQWAEALAASDHGTMAAQLRLALPGLHEHLANEFARYRELGLPRGWDSLNAPSFAQAVQLIEQAGYPCTLLHDECASLDASFRFFYGRYCRADRTVVSRRDGSVEIFGLRCLSALTFGNSETLPLLRASDYLLAACVDFARRALAGEEISDLQRASASHGLARMMHLAAGRAVPHDASAQVGQVMASDAWINRVAFAFTGSGERKASPR